MNFKAVVGWGFYGAASATQRANLWSSWGLMESLPAATPSVIASLLESLPLRFWNRILGRAQLQKSQFGKM